MPDYRLAARRAARKYGVDPNIFERQIGAESRFREGVKSPAGAEDIAQFMPATARQYGVTLGDNRAADDLDGAARMMRDLLRQNGGNYHRALSAYNSGRPDGYQHIAETRAYVAKILQGQGGTSQRGDTAGGGSSSRTVTRTVPGVDRSEQRRMVRLAYLQQRGNPDALLELQAGLQGAQDTPSRTVTRTVRSAGSPSSDGGHGELGTFEGKKVAAWIVPLLKYARERGWKGTVTSGYRSYDEQKRIYDSGVRPAAKPGQSNHERTGFLQGAIDVTDAAELDRILRRKHSRLKFAGAKDPVHFSVPRNGTY